MRAIASLFALLFAASAQAQTAPPTAGQSAVPLELKGVTLGGLLADVRTIAPAATCEEKKPGLTLCIDKTATLGGFKAELWLNYLDGMLINVDYRRLAYRDALAIEAGLVEKFGTPETRYRNGQLKDGAYRTHTLSFWYHADTSLSRDPLDWKDKRTEDVYSNVSLKNSRRWREEWVPRLKGESATPVASNDL